MGELVKSPKVEKIGKFDKWEVEGWADTIIRAEEIKADKEKMAAVKPILEKKIAGVKKAVESIADIKAIRQEKAEKEMEQEEPGEEAETEED